MKVVFLKKDPGIFSALIRWWTNSPYDHCELLFDDGVMFSAHQTQGTRFWTPGTIDPAFWDALLIPTSMEEEVTCRAFCMSENGCKYDWFGLVFSQVLKLQREHASRWFCSEICTAALQRLGWVTSAKPCTFSPGKLYKRLREAGAQVCDA